MNIFFMHGEFNEYVIQLTYRNADKLSIDPEVRPKVLGVTNQRSDEA